MAATVEVVNPLPESREVTQPPSSGTTTSSRRSVVSAWTITAGAILLLIGSQLQPLSPPWLAAATVAQTAFVTALTRGSFVRRALKTMLILIVLAGIALGWRQFRRYRTGDELVVAIREYSNAEYPEDPANRSPQFGQYHGRQMKLIRRDATHFDFVLDSSLDHIARITFRNVDVSLMTPSLPESCRDHSGNLRIALTDRQWNRQQVSFSVTSPEIEITGGDGVEKQLLTSVELAKNCLNAGLWEVLLFTDGASGKELLYQCWFTFPLGFYRDLFESNTELSYNDHWYYLEHWFDPAGSVMDLKRLRADKGTIPATVSLNMDERIFASGEQVRTKRTVIGTGLKTWADFATNCPARFATFIPPGRYSVDHPWKNEYGRIATFDSGVLRKIQPANSDVSRAEELELRFRDSNGQICRLFISGIQCDQLPQLAVGDYSEGLYMPMGIGVPPFFQSYGDLQKNPPQQSAYFCVMLDDQDRWIDHHKVAVDGPVLFRDATDPRLVHLCLLSYERHTLVRHFTIQRTE